MGDMLKLIWWVVTGLFRSRASLETEILTLRHQLNVLHRKAPKRLVFSNFDLLVFASLYRLAPGHSRRDWVNPSKIHCKYETVSINNSLNAG